MLKSPNTVNRLMLVTIFILMVTLIYWVTTINQQFTVIDNKQERVALTTAHNSYKLRFGHDMPEQSMLHVAAQRFAEEVNRKSAGMVTIEIFPAEKLGTDAAMLELQRNGELNLLLIPTAKLSIAIPQMQYVDLPFYFRSRDELYSMLDGEPGRLLLEKVGAIGLVGLSFWGNGFKQFTSNRPIQTPDDFQGLRMRTMKSRLIVEQFRDLQAQSIPIEFQATLQALANGVADGQENPLETIYTMGFYKAQSHLTISSHAYLGYAFTMSGKTHQLLPVSLRQMIIETAQQQSILARSQLDQREQDLLQYLREAGMQIATLSDKNRALFINKLRHLPYQFEHEIGADLLAKTEYLRLVQNRQMDKYYIIGIDVDLSRSNDTAGISIRRGVELAVDEINSNGGLLGREIRIVTMDNQGQISQAQNNFQKIAELPNLLAIVGGKRSQLVLQLLDRAHDLKIPFLIPWAAAEQVTKNQQNPNYIFRVSAADSFSVPFLMHQAVEKKQKVALCWKMVLGDIVP